MLFIAIDYHFLVFRIHQRNFEVEADTQLEYPHDTDCNEPENLVRVTLSIMVRRNIRGGNHRNSVNTNSGIVRRGK